MASLKLKLLETTYAWCIEHGLTPHLLIEVDDSVQVPLNYVEHGRIVLNVSPIACQEFWLSEDGVAFNARFRGVAHRVYAPLQKVGGLFAKESSEGVYFAADGGVAAKAPSKQTVSTPTPKTILTQPEPAIADSGKKQRSFLRVIKSDDKDTEEPSGEND
jgi:stringent starvation protein B